MLNQNNDEANIANNQEPDQAHRPQGDCAECGSSAEGNASFERDEYSDHGTAIVHGEALAGDFIARNDYLERAQAAAEAGAAWGCFHIGFDYNGPFMGCNTFFSNRRARRGIAFGDQGIWIRRELFLSLGGFPELPIMEDYEFSLRMKERGIPIRLLPGRIITSGRRYRKGFPLFTMWNMYRLRQMYRAGVDISEIAERYRDIR